MKLTVASYLRPPTSVADLAAETHPNM